MNRSTGRIAIVLIVALTLMAELGFGQDSNAPANDLKGIVQFRYGYIGVDGDRGRFREDNWITDRSTGGIDWLHIENTQPTDNGYKVLFEGRALYDYDYDLSLLLKKENSHYLKFDFDSKRRYFDGSNEFWNQSLYNLPGSSLGFSSLNGTNEHPDGSFFVDRRNYNIELGLTPPEGPQWTFGWHRLVKDGKEVILRGEEAVSPIAGVPKFRGIPSLTHMAGITDTIYGEVAQTFAEKYNFRLRQEFEQFHDHQLTESVRFKADGTLNQVRNYIDDPGYTLWRTIGMFDSFLDERTYVTANYMYSFLDNDSTRSEIRPNLGQPNAFRADAVGNSTRTNAGTLGYRKANVLDVEKLDFSAGTRIEDAHTTSQGRGFGGSPFPTLRIARSDKDDVRFGETLRLVYKGFKRTTLSFDADLQQRFLDWKEFEDVRSHEIVNNPAEHLVRPARNFLDWRADIDHTDQIYTLKTVHRFSRDVKSTVKFRYKDLERSYTNVFDNDPIFFPGYMGSYRRTGNDFYADVDFRINDKTSSTLLYEFIQESINTHIGGKTQNLEIHRGAGSLSFTPMQNLFLVATFMLENYNLDTPVNAAPGTSIAPGTQPFDFVGNSYSLLLDSTYAFNEKTSSTVGFQHTEALGTVDFAGDYVFDKVGITLKHKITEKQAIGLGYAFYDFNNHKGGSFDDYIAHGAFVTYSFAF